jgi:hypothetical protein
MNVVFSPALASTFAAAADGLLCMEGTCLFGWAWTLAALTFLSAAIVQRWHSGGEAGRHLLRVSPSAPASAGALLPRLPGLAPQTRAPSARLVAEPAACLSLRAPPLTFERAEPAIQPADAPSLPSRRPDRRSPGTPTQPPSPDEPGRYPPA